MSEPSYADGLRLTHRLTERALRQALERLDPPAGSRGLDAGCGIGTHALWLAKAVGAQGCVVGLDLKSEHASRARSVAQEACSTGGVDVVVGDVIRPPFRGESFDWVWCADTLWPGMIAVDPTAALFGLRDLVKPGGWIALAYWSGQSLLPGYPGLEIRLHQAFAETTRYLRGVPPERQSMRATGWFQQAGMERVQARTYVADICGPLTPPEREALAFVAEMLWGGLAGSVTSDDWAELHRLTAEDSLFARPDYYGYILYTCFWGQVPRASVRRSSGLQAEAMP